MDIIIEFQPEEYDSTIADGEKYLEKPEGFQFHSVNKKPKKTKKGDRIYFLCDGKIIGYAILDFIRLIDDEYNTLFRGRLWAIIGKYFIAWRDKYWYQEGYSYTKKLGFYNWRYFKLKKWLNGRTESRIKV